jgi:type I restriction enzyme M protein
MFQPTSGESYEWFSGICPQPSQRRRNLNSPRVIQLLIEILDPKPLESVYDPACGAARMLIVAYKHVKKTPNMDQTKPIRLLLFGQEANPSILALAKMNTYIMTSITHIWKLGTHSFTPI